MTALPPSASNSLVPPAPAAGADDPPAPLRLSVARGQLGLELYEPVLLGPLEVQRLSLSLDGLNYPVDLSGGVRVFRHRRGRLRRAALSLSLDDLRRWLTPRLPQLIGDQVRAPNVWFDAPRLSLGVAGARAALAIEVGFAPIDDSARLVVLSARGAGLKGPALGYALRLLDSVLGKLASRRGRVFSIERCAWRIGVDVLPALGARAPSARGVRFGPLRGEQGALNLELDDSFAPPAIPQTCLRALELAELTRGADDALAAGELDQAREGYMLALEDAPRQPELCQLVAEIDLAQGGREDAALGLLVESGPVIDAGLVGARLLALTGDLPAASAALNAALAREAYAPLSALLWLELAELETNASRRAEALDRAVACAPGLAAPRWARFRERVRRGDVNGAFADSEHLEAAARGSRPRYEVLERAGQGLWSAGFTREAGRVFERALRYVPDAPAATAGLGRALWQTGQVERAVALLERAVSLADRQGQSEGGALVDLARILAGPLADLPQAIARARQVPAHSEHAVEARYLEANYRKRLGDIAGASLAYARLRELCELSAGAPREVARWLGEAAEFEREVRADIFAAERHLSQALRLAPRDHMLSQAYREVASVLAARSVVSAHGATEPPPAGAGGGTNAATERPPPGDDEPAGLMPTLPPPEPGED